MNEAMTQKCIVVGVDGFDPVHAKFLMDQGKMPNLKRYMEKGAAREDMVLLGGMPTVTPPMWTTLATGATAATHGITAFFNTHPEKLDTTVYALDSRKCKAELLWNVTAEAGMNTLVWHWPGSSWPPTSDSSNLSVVDGTQPSSVNTGTAIIDWEKIVLADETMTDLQYAAHDASDKGVAGCVITGLEDVVASEDDSEKMSAATFRKMVASSKESTILVMDESETEIDMLASNNVDMVNSYIRPANGWTNAPEDAKEFAVLISSGYTRRPCLILKNEEGIFDRVAIYKSKKDSEPLFVVKSGEINYWYFDENIKNEETKETYRCVKIMELATDGSRLKLYLGSAMDFHGNAVWHPKELMNEVFDNIGVVPTIPTVTCAEPENVYTLVLPSWDKYCAWQADCLTYMMDKEKYDVIFSHLHNLDACGHRFWHFAKHRDVWANEETFYQKAMDYVYKQTDDYLGRFLPYVDKGWTVIITSDHGLITEENHPPVLTEGTVSIPVMKELGYTVLQKDATGKELRAIDWSKTRAVAVRGGQIYLNVKGRNPGGIVASEDKYALEDQIISDLYNYRDPHTGRRVVSVALRNKDAILLGMSGPECGDIIFFMEEGFNIIHMDSLSTQQGYYHTSVSPIFVAAGPGIKQNYRTERVIRQVDVAPTIATLLGVRMPQQCEGAPAYQIFEEIF